MSRLVNHLFRGGAYVALAVRHRSSVGRDLRVHRKRAGVQRRAVEECHGSHPALRLVSLLDEQGGCARGAGGLRRGPRLGGPRAASFRPWRGDPGTRRRRRVAAGSGGGDRASGGSAGDRLAQGGAHLQTPQRDQHILRADRLGRREHRFRPRGGRHRRGGGHRNPVDRS